MTEARYPSESVEQVSIGEGAELDLDTTTHRSGGGAAAGPDPSDPGASRVRARARANERTLQSVAAAMLERLPEITDQLVDSIVAGDSAYRPEPSETLLVSRADLAQSCHENLGQVLTVLAGREELREALGVPRATGDRRARQGLPLEALLHAYRLGGQVIWQEMVAVLMTGPRAGKEMRELLEAATGVWAAVDAFSVAAAGGYRRAEAEQDLRLDRRLTAIMGGLLSGQHVSPHDALALGLPQTGNFVVVAIPLSTADETAPAARRALGADGIASVWRPHGDREVGIIVLSTPTPEARGIARVTDILRGVAAGPVGVSGVVHRLADISEAFADAARALDTLPAGDRAVATLGDRLLPAILSNSPELARRQDRACLGALDALPGPERTALLDTLAAWFDADGDVRQVATALFCHRNTVYNRLLRIEALTGRSTRAPVDVAMLYVSLMARQIGVTVGRRDD